MKRIIGIGETVFDIIFKNGQPTAAVPGGSTFNAITSLGRTVHKAYPDVQVMMVTDVGDDYVGNIVTAHLESSHVCTDAVTRIKGAQSSVSLALLNENNDATYEFFKDRNLSSQKQSRADDIVFTKDDIVLFGSFFAIDAVRRDFIWNLVTRAREAGATIYYDINFRPSHQRDLQDVIGFIGENCHISDYVRGSSEDFEYIYGIRDGEEIYSNHISPLCSNMILTRGAGPVGIYTPEGHWEFPVEKIKAISTIGAGDNFNAGFIYSLLAGSNDWSRRVATATKFSAAVCRSVFNYVDESFEA